MEDPFSKASPPQKKSTLDDSCDQPFIKHLHTTEKDRNPTYLNARTASNEINFDEPI